MDRKIVVDVNGSYLRKDNKIAGVQGEGNSTYLNLIFDEGWSGLAKKITFWNSKGMNPVEITLTTDHLTNMSTSLLDYTVSIPPEPLEFDGEMEYVIDGYKDGVRVRSLADKMVVKYAPTANNAGSPADPTPTQAEQLQKQIDTMLGDMQAERIKAETAASTSQQAAETSVLAKGSAESAAQTATTKAGEASDSASAAKTSEENAKQSETNAKASEESAANYAQTAINKALEAKQTLEEAITAKNSAESAKTVAETARNETLTAKNESIAAKTSAETAKDDAISAKTAAETAQSSAETAKNESISAKEDAISAKIAAETARDQAQEIAGGDFATRAELTEGLSTKLSASDIINNLTSGGTSVPLSAEQGKVLKGLIDKLNGDSSEVGSVAYQIAQIVAGADTRYDTIKEIADWIINDTTGAAKMASDILALQNEMSNHTHDDRYYTESEIDSKISDINTSISGKAPSDHNHDDRYYTEAEIDSKISDINTSLAQKSQSGHTHDDRYYTEAEIDSKLDTKAPAYTYGTDDLTAGTSALETGKLYFVYE